MQTLYAATSTPENPHTTSDLSTQRPPYHLSAALELWEGHTHGTLSIGTSLGLLVGAIDVQDAEDDGDLIALVRTRIENTLGRRVEVELESWEDSTALFDVYLA